MCSGKKTQLKKTSARPEGRRPRGRRLHIQTGEISALSERRWQVPAISGSSTATSMNLHTPVSGYNRRVLGPASRGNTGPAEKYRSQATGTPARTMPIVHFNANCFFAGWVGPLSIAHGLPSKLAPPALPKLGWLSAVSPTAWSPRQTGSRLRGDQYPFTFVQTHLLQHQPQPPVAQYLLVQPQTVLIDLCMLASCLISGT